MTGIPSSNMDDLRGRGAVALLQPCTKLAKSSGTTDPAVPGPPPVGRVVTTGPGRSRGRARRHPRGRLRTQRRRATKAVVTISTCRSKTTDSRSPRTSPSTTRYPVRAPQATSGISSTCPPCARPTSTNASPRSTATPPTMRPRPDPGQPQLTCHPVEPARLHRRRDATSTSPPHTKRPAASTRWKRRSRGSSVNNDKKIEEDFAAPHLRGPAAAAAAALGAARKLTPSLSHHLHQVGGEDHDLRGVRGVVVVDRAATPNVTWC